MPGGLSIGNGFKVEISRCAARVYAAVTLKLEEHGMHYKRLTSNDAPDPSTYLCSTQIGIVLAFWQEGPPLAGREAVVTEAMQPRCCSIAPAAVETMKHRYHCLPARESTGVAPAL